MIAVGYSRTLLARSYRRRLWPTLILAFCVVAILTVVEVATGGAVLQRPLGAVLYLALVILSFTALRSWFRRRFIQLVRMENVNASRLWATETPAPPPPPFPTPAESSLPGSGPVAAEQPVAFRFSSRKLLRAYGTVGAVLALVELIVWSEPDERVMAALLTCAFLFVIGWSVFQVIRRIRPWEAPVVLDAKGVVFPSLGGGVVWSEVTEIRLSPVRGGGNRAAQRKVVAFLVNDPEAVVARFPASAQKRLRRSWDVYGTPISVTDLLLENTADDIVTTAARFTSVPVRRFGSYNAL
ncbi:hypothetical protein [Actinoallomurus sp. NPDC050550]|uniref:hypothetical protein n=1 Tax=Actinoallomurus sp. NPDC050550 TaxID=3154937 RepID=UPI0033C607D8